MLPILVILLGILLILVSVKKIHKDQNEIIENDQNSFNAILKKEEVNNNRDYDAEIISIRKDMAETVLDLQKEIEELRASINLINSSNNKKENNDIEDDGDNNKSYKNENINLNESVISEINFSHIQNNKTNKYEEDNNKMQRVKELINKGLSDDEICNRLSIGKGEVLLIKGLLK